MGTDMHDPHVAAWLKERPPLPEWVDRGRMSRGAAFFAEWGLQLGLGLFLSSLPLAYAAHDGVQVLALTAQLESNAKRRVLESAQFVLDVTAPGRPRARAAGIRDRTARSADARGRAAPDPQRPPRRAHV